MYKIMFIWGCLLTINSHAVTYDEHELNRELSQLELNQLSQQFSQQYFTAKTAETVIDEIFKADISPLQREYLFYNLLSEISQQPPQAFHQYFVDLMKKYQVQATKAADEGPFPVAVFNLNSKAHGIENIWLAYRTEQQFNQLFNTDMSLAITDIQQALANQTPQWRPQWLGIKNSIAALSAHQTSELIQQLQNNTKVNAGLDKLISHVGLLTADHGLILKALTSSDPSIRQFTLRNLINHLPADETKSLLLDATEFKQDNEFITSMLAAFSNDTVVQNHLILQLDHEKTADNAAFALSQSTDKNLAERLKTEYLTSTVERKKNHILLALKLNKSNSAQLALHDLKKHIDANSMGGKWLKSFNGEQP